MPLTQTELARIFGRTRQQVEEWVNRGTIPADATTAEEALLGAVNWFARMRSGRFVAGEGGKILDLASERAKLAAAQTETAELKNAEMRGELVPQGDVFESWAAQALAMKERLRGIPAAATVHIQGFSKAMARGLAGLIDEALTELADGRNFENAARPKRSRRDRSEGSGTTPPAA